MPRHPRFSTGGYVFHVLNRGAGRQTLFDSDTDYDAFVALLEEARRQAPMRVLAYCVMPNHWHLVLWPETDFALSEYMHWLTVTHSVRWHAWRKTGGTGPVYQGRFKSFPVQEDDHFLALCRYVERNPLRAGLVTRAESWKWCSLWQRDRCAATVTLNSWPVPVGKSWVEYVNDAQTEAEVEGIRQCITRGRPFGDSRWVRGTARTLGLQRTLRSRGSSGRT